MTRFMSTQDVRLARTLNSKKLVLHSKLNLSSFKLDPLQTLFGRQNVPIPLDGDPSRLSRQDPHLCRNFRLQPPGFIAIVSRECHVHRLAGGQQLCSCTMSEVAC